MDLKISHILIAGFMIVASTIIAIMLGMWWAAFDQPDPYPRPTIVMWNIINLDLRNQGSDLEPENDQIDNNPIIKMGGWVLSVFGSNYRNLLLVQIPFLFLLVLSSGLLAWRFAGVFAGGLAPWFVIFGPMTVGLLANGSDFLAFQAFCCAALAALAWSTKEDLWWAAVAAIPLVWSGIQMTVHFSNGLLFLIVFAVGAACLVLYQVFEYRSFKKHPTKDYAANPLPAALCAIAALVVGIFSAQPIPFDYLFNEATSERFEGIGVLSNPNAFLAFPLIWFYYYAGPFLAICTAIAVAAALIGRRLKCIVPFLGWLLLPMILFVILNKRNPFYLIAIAPATYIIIAVGVSALKNKIVRLSLSGFCICLACFGWFQIVSKPVDSKLVQRLSPMLDGKPHPYLTAPLPGADFEYTDIIQRYGVMAMNNCVNKGMPVLFFEQDRPGIREWPGFILWHQDPRLVDFRFKNLQKPHCLGIDIGGLPIEVGLADFLKKSRSAIEAETGKDPRVALAIEQISNEQNKYHPVYQIAEWALYQKADTAVTAPE